jgi:hypothetical protein
VKRKGGQVGRGFELVTDTRRRVLKVKLWGLWDAKIAADYRAQGLECVREMGSDPWSVLLDARLFPAQAEEVSRVRVELMTIASRTGMRRMASLVGTAVGKLQTSRLVDEGQVREVAFFDDEEDALEWLDRS